MEARILICANPPGTRPTITSAMRTRRVETPPRAINDARKDKENHGQQGKGVDGRQHPLDDRGIVYIPQRHTGDDCPNTDRKRNRHIDHQQNKKNSDC